VKAYPVQVNIAKCYLTPMHTNDLPDPCQIIMTEHLKWLKTQKLSSLMYHLVIGKIKQKTVHLVQKNLKVEHKFRKM
jgi:hypothetical protein